MIDRDVLPAPLSKFEERWLAGKERGMYSGNYTTQDPLIAAMWYHAGCADMAREFAAGCGATIAKLDAIERAIRECGEAIKSAPVVTP
jgi:hypothetical protein